MQFLFEEQSLITSILQFVEGQTGARQGAFGTSDTAMIPALALGRIAHRTRRELAAEA